MCDTAKVVDAHCTETSEEIAAELCKYGGMDEPSVKTEKPKLEDLTFAQLIVLLEEAVLVHRQMESSALG